MTLPSTISFLPPDRLPSAQALVVSIFQNTIYARSSVLPTEEATQRRENPLRGPETAGFCMSP